MADRPTVTVPRPGLIFCRTHGEYLRPVWGPAVYVVFAKELLDAFFSDPEIVAAAGGNIERASALIEEYGPLCSRYPSALPAAWRAAGLGALEICGNCGERREAAPQTLFAPQTEESVTTFICFECCKAAKCDPFKRGEWDWK